MGRMNERVSTRRPRDPSPRRAAWEGASLDRPEYLGQGRFRFGDDEIVFEGDERCDDGFTLSVDRARGIRFCRAEVVG